MPDANLRRAWMLTWTRRLIVPAVVLAAMLVVPGCSPDSSPSTPTGITSAPPLSDVTALITLNHGHVAWPEA